MDGYVFCLKPDETDGYGWQYIKQHEDRLVKMDFEVSSIDLGTTVSPRFIINDIVYDVVRQYFARVSTSNTMRIFLLRPLLQENENGDYAKSFKRRPLIYTGADSYTQRKMNNKESSKNDG